MHLVCERFTLALGPRSGRADRHHHERFPVAETPREHCSLAALGVTATPGTTRNRTQRTRARRACPGLPRVGCVRGEFEGAGKLGERLPSPCHHATMPPRHHAVHCPLTELVASRIRIRIRICIRIQFRVMSFRSTNPPRQFANASLPACSATCTRTRKASRQWS